MTSIEIFNQYPQESIDIKPLRSLIDRVLKTEKWNFHINLIIVGDSEICRLNRLFLSTDDVTDVIAFSSGDDDPPGGEIYLSLDQAKIQAEEASESLLKAASRLTVHGILHLGGWDDVTDSDRDRMLKHGEVYLSGMR
ncbi:rRNA maturation RNase YbeY [candidate division LCP-89 bacterium B3_LCP]|uniref:Endoribonuclease YbeY n=1 Tax=candidate division LCP-89 bacterium B3_LCP TaxID=2012998 RepID=A0A532URM1_UNCL8|nr:MAG: rRNA maturation RNase YbeY [candidate division LCP-89 bacterium B3_LCP]